MRHLRLAALVVGAMLVGSALYAQGTTPATGKTTTCKDGTTVSVAKNACKDHGGYVRKKKKETAAAEKKEEKKEEMKEEKAEKKAAKKP